MHFDETGLNIIFNNGSGGQTADITDCTKAGNYYYSWDGGSGYSLIKYEEGGDSPIPDPQPDNSLHAYFINTPGWGNVMCWAWNDSENFTGGSWPGAQCTKLTIKGDNGEDIWEWKYTGTSTGTPTGIIFNNGSGGTGNQTGDFTFSNGSFYNFDGQTATPKSATGIGNVFFLMDRPTPVYNTIGVRVAVLQSPADISRLPRGLYIINGRKYAVK